MQAINFTRNNLRINLNLWQVTLSAILIAVIMLPRLLPFSPSFITSDEMQIAHWTTQMSQALLDGKWEETANNAYPAVTLMWLDTAQILLLPWLPNPSLTTTQMLADTDPEVFASLPRRRLSLALVNSLIVITIFWLLRRLYNLFVAVVATILIALDPFLLTQVRVFRTEGLNAGLMLLSALFILLYAKEKQKRWLIFSGILAAWATLTKFTSIYLLPFSGLTLLVWDRLEMSRRQIGQRLKQLSYDVGGWLLVMSLTFFICWPALWSSPVATFDILSTYLFRAASGEGVIWGKGGVFFLGELVETDPGVLFYLWSLAYRTTPLVWLGLIALIGFNFRSLLSRPQKQARTDLPASAKELQLATLLIFCYLLFYLIGMSLGVSKIDRYLLPIFPGLSILAAVGFFQIVKWSTERKRFSGMEPGIWIIVLSGSLWLIIPHHPYYLTYWNPLLGGSRRAVERLPVGNSEGVGVDRLVAHLNTLPDATHLNLSGPRSQLYCPFAFKGNCLGETEFLESDYFITHIFAQQKQWKFSNILAYVPEAQRIDTFTKDGLDYAQLYKMPEGLQSTKQWLGTHGQFKGFRLSATEAGAGDPMDMTIFWLNGEQGWTMADSEFFVKVVDSAGQVQQLAPAHLKPEFASSQTQPGEILVFTAPFPLSPDLAPDIYSLEIGLRLKATAAETWNFSMAGLANTLTINRGALNISAEVLPIQYRVNETIGETGLVFLGYNDLKLGEIPRVELYWQAKRALTEDYWIDLILLDGSDQVLATWRSPLSSELHPLSTWQPGEIVKMSFPLGLAQKLPAGPYRPILSVLPADTSTRPVAQVHLLLN